MAHSQHSSYMQLALSLAAKGRGRVHPNPMVGCVLVKNGRIVGRGWHDRFGGPHAEVNALQAAGKKANGATLYLTLEPCTHVGKTPPCTPALIKAGIRHAYIAMKDPNPLVFGRGIAMLKKAGIRVHLGLEKSATEALNRPFLTWMTQSRPHVVLKLAASLDGKIATKTLASKWISSPESRRLGHELRAQSDAVLVGIGTALADNPTLTSHGRGRNPMRVIVDPHFRIRPSLALVRQQPTTTLILTGVSPQKAQIKHLTKRGVRVAFFKTSQEKIKVNEILTYLSKNSVSQLLIEGGSETAWSFLNAGLVDELFLFLAPIIIGGRQGIGAVGGEGVKAISDAIPLKSYHVKKIGRDLLIHGKF